MTVQEFAKYVLENIGRATLVNSFNIINKLDTEDGYPFLEFVESIKNNLEVKDIKDMKIAIACSEANSHYGESKYVKQMVIDKFIMEIWKAVSEG